MFWTRNPRPLMPHLSELDQRGLRYYFQYTVMADPRPIDPKSPPVDAAIRSFVELAERVGPEKVIWRYDPIVLTPITPFEFHTTSYARIATALRGSTHRSVISLVDHYQKARQRLDSSIIA